MNTPSELNCESRTESSASSKLIERDYFDLKMLETLQASAYELANYWQRLNPHEPELQNQMSIRLGELMTYIQRFETHQDKLYFAIGGYEGHQGKIRIEVEIDRTPSAITNL